MKVQSRSVEVRAYLHGDAPATLAAFLSAVTVTAASDYSPEQVVAWSAPQERALTEWNWARITLGTIVATIDGEVAGFSDVSGDGHIDMMFVAAPFGRLGVASTLLAQLEHAARIAGAATLSTGASITARRFFQRHGFEVVAEQHPIVRGVRMANYRMVKRLTSPVVEISRAVAADAAGVAHVHVEAWRQAYARELPAGLGGTSRAHRPNGAPGAGDGTLEMTRPRIPASVQLRHAEPGDLLVIEAIENAADATLIEGVQPEHWEPAPSGAVRAAQPGFILIAVDDGDGSAIGFAHVLEIEDVAHIEQLSVLPTRGRNGYGRRLIEALLAEARDRGYNELTLRTYADVPWNAPFYATCGFTETEPATDFHRHLHLVEEGLGLGRYGRRIQMTVKLIAR